MKNFGFGNINMQKKYIYEGEKYNYRAIIKDRTQDQIMTEWKK